MDDDLPKLLRCWEGRLRGLERNKKILVIFILMLSMGLFFYSTSSKSALAGNSFRLINLSAEIIDPLSRIGKGIAMEDEKEKDIPILDKAEKQITNPLKEVILKLVVGYPIEEMAKDISEQDKLVASFLIAIAKKESAWGKRVPIKDGRDCFNYWGYRGGENPTDSGYSCFESTKQAVAVVGKRIKKLVEEGFNTPEKMLVWKCGSTCVGHDPVGVRKWVSDVGLYVNKLN